MVSLIYIYIIDFVRNDEGSLLFVCVCVPPPIPLLPPSVFCLLLLPQNLLIWQKLELTLDLIHGYYLVFEFTDDVIHD